MIRRVYYSLYDRLLNKEILYKAFKRVRASRGAGGIDRQSIEDFESDVVREITTLLSELRTKNYRPYPVKRVEIPKGDGKVRLLGIPAVRDRVVQQALKSILEPIFEEDFHPSSYGYRPGRGCHMAITKASDFIRKHDLNDVVDMDLSRCFDTLNHSLIIKSVRKRVTDGSILKLIDMFLKSGIMIGDVFHKSDEGSPQGGVISPLLANIYLNEFDQFMMGRKYRIVRYADDILIFGQSKRSAEHALKVATKFLEEDLKLTVNREKTHITTSREGVKFLGVIIRERSTSIQEKKIEAFKKKIRFLTKKNKGKNLEMMIRDLNPVLRGFANYFRIANCKRLFESLMSWIRRRLRAVQMKLWKKPNRLLRRLREMGFKGDTLKMRMTNWRSSRCDYAHRAMPNKWFIKIGLFHMDQVKTGIVVPV